MSISFEQSGEKVTYFDLDLAGKELAKRTIRLTLRGTTGRFFGKTATMSFQLETRAGTPCTIHAQGTPSINMVCDLLDAR